MALRLTLYGRTYCHLCEDMVAALEPWRLSGAIELTIVDVDASAELEDQLGELVPVLAGPEGEICHYFLDIARLDEVLARVG